VVALMFDQKSVELELLLPSALNVASKRRTRSKRRVTVAPGKRRLAS
jgi:hypothetical protein